MNKKSMFLLALALLLTGVSFEKSPVSAKENKYSSGAIIEQLTQDNTKELSKIWENFGSKDKYFDRQIALIEYYENIANIGKVSDLFFETLAEIKDIENNAKKKEAINKLTTYIQDCVNNQPFNSRYLYYLSKIEKELINDSENAYNLLQQALNFDKTNPVYLFEKAQYELNNNNYKKAIRIMEALKRNYPRELDYRIGLAKAYTQEGSYDAAIKEYRVAAVFEPDNNDTIIALNDLTQYSKIAKHSGGVFYDPMTAVKPAASPKGEKLVAFNSQTNQTLKSTSSNIQKATVVSQAYRPQNVNTTSLQNISTNKPQKVQKSIPSSKRVMVSYVNGRKVVKIVNINSNTDTTQTLQNASETFSTQLESANSGYKTTQTASNKEQYSLSPSKKQSTVGSMESTTFEKPVSNTSYTDTTKSKYSINENISTQKIEKTTDYSQPLGKIETNNNNGDPSVKALNYNPSKKQLLVTYQNGKRVVKMVSPNTTPNQEINKNENKNNHDKKQKNKEKNKNTTNISVNNQDNTDLYIKANEFLTQEQYQSAIDTLKQVQPATLRSITAIASCYNSLGQTDTAIDYYKQADKLSPNNTQILYSIGYLYFSKNDKVSAQKYIDMALKADSTNQNALQLRQYMTQNVTNEATNQAVTYMNQGKYSESKKILEKSLQENPNNFQSYYYLGHIGYATQKYEEAVRNFASAIKLNPDYALSYYSIGLAYDKLKEFNKSIAAYQQFLQMENDDNKYTQYAKTRINTIKSKQ